MGGEGWVDGWVDRWAVCEVYEVWADRWAVCEVYEVWAVKPRFYEDKVFKVGKG